MEARLSLYREEGERPLPKDLVEKAARRGGRPKVPPTLLLHTARDVERLRRRKVPLFLVSPDKVTEEGYPMDFEPRVALPAGLTAQVKSDLKLLLVRDEETLRDPGLETLAALMLRVDKLAARALVVRNRKRVRPSELYRVVVNEGLEREATRVRFQDFASELPVVGTPLPARDLAWVMRNNPAPSRSR